MLNYSIPVTCPIPFPAHPQYPVTQINADQLKASYEAALCSISWNYIDLNKHRQFARELVQTITSAKAVELGRNLLLPIQDFDHKFRTTIPQTIGPAKSENANSLLLQSFTNFRAGRKTDESDATCLQNWLELLELSETMMQCSISLLLLSTSSSDMPQTPPPTATSQKNQAQRKRKKKKRENDPATMDPLIHLDFLVDRIQVWQVMQDVDTATINETDSIENPLSELVHVWWTEVITPLFSTRLKDPSLIYTHGSRLIKSFSGGLQQSLTTRISPEPSPLGKNQKSLLSLDRKHTSQMSNLIETVSASPTLKRLLETSETRLETLFSPTTPSQKDNTTEAPKSAKRPRKQENPRPRPLNRSQSKLGHLGRREVSINKTRRSLVLSDVDLSSNSRERERKRKKTGKISQGNSTRLLVPESPAKKPFARTHSMPSFSNLGAAFKPGSFPSPDADPFVCIPSSPPNSPSKRAALCQSTPLEMWDPIPST